jgi:hypothetical protein
MARTEARLDATGAVTRRRSTGLWEPVAPRTDWARVDATTNAEIERQAAFDDAEAAEDAGRLGAARSQTRRTVTGRVCAPDRHICREGT